MVTIIITHEKFNLGDFSANELIRALSIPDVPLLYLPRRDAQTQAKEVSKREHLAYWGTVSRS